MNDSLDKAPEPTAKDYAYAIFKGAVSSIPIPIFGGVAAEVLSLIIAPPLSKRQEKWIESIAQGLANLQDKVDGFKLENLSENESFITTVMHATQAAIRNHQKEKVEALRNAVLNSALPNAPDEDLQQIFLNFVDELTPWHIRILTLFDNPVAVTKQRNIDYSNKLTSSTTTLVEQVYPGLQGKQEFYRQVFNDLATRGLATIPTGMMTPQGVLSSRTSSTGKEFLKFITLPPELK